MDELVEFRLSVSRPAADECTIAVGGELDLYSCPELKKAIRAVPDDVTTLTLDLTGISFVDSAGLGILVTAAKKISPSRVTLLVDDHNVLKVLTITGLDRLFEIRGGRRARRLTPARQSSSDSSGVTESASPLDVFAHG
jgi:anti-sigma B factor antagonist